MVSFIGLFCKETYDLIDPTNPILQKRPIISSILLTKATPYAIRSDFFGSSFQSSKRKLVRLLCRDSVKIHIRAFSFELWEELPEISRCFMLCLRSSESEGRIGRVWGGFD